MESKLSGQNIAIGASSQDISEIKIASLLKETESSSSQNSGAILKTVAKTKSGGVKLGSFKLGGRKKINSEEDSSLEVKEVKKKSKKMKKDKSCDDSDKQESEGSSVSTPSPGIKQSIPSKASSLVRKLSIGKYKASGSRKTLKSPDTPSSQDEYQSVSTEEECFVTQSPSSAATNGHPSLEVSTTPGQDAAGPVGQWTVTKGSKSDSDITDSFTPTTPGITDSLPVLELTSQHELYEIVNGKEENMIVGEASLPTTATNSDPDNLAAVRTCAFESGQSEDGAIANANGDIVLRTQCSESVILTPVCTIPPCVEEDKWPDSKDRFQALTSLLTAEQRDELEEYRNQLRSMCMEATRQACLDKDLYWDLRMLGSSEQGRPYKPVLLSDTSHIWPSSLLHRVQMPEQKVGEKREHLYKILVIGELGTGKTSIIKRYVHQFFSQHYRATIGVDFALKVLNWDANTIVRLQLWDIAGQERFGNMTRVYYKEAVGAFIVFDVTRAATFDAVVKWKQDLDAKVQLPDGSPIPCVLLANKCDQQKEGLVNNPSKMDEYCKERGFTAWFETSAKENINIEDAASCLVSKILQNNRMINNSESSNDLERFTLDGRNQRDQKSKTCGC